MRARAALVLPLLAAPLALGAGAAAAPSPQQALLERTIVADAKTTSAVKRGLGSDRLLVDPRSGFVDVTGDGRSDAIALVTAGGAAGTVALYVLSTDGAPATDDGAEPPLRAVLRLQQLHRATVRVSGATVTVVEPKWARGDDLCCPGTVRERDYTWSADAKAFRRTALRDVARRTSQE